MNSENNIQAAIDAGEQIVQHQIVEIDDRPVAYLHHKDLNSVPLNFSDFSQSAFRKKGSRAAHTPADFCGMVARYSDAAATLSIQASVKDRTLTAILNDDAPSPGKDETLPPYAYVPTAGWKDDIITMKVSESRELGQWRPFFDWRGQLDFAEFLEEHVDEVEGGAELLELALTLDLTRDSQCKSAVRLQTGGTQLNYQDDTSSSVIIPDRIKLLIPLFAGGPIFKLEAFLRYRLRGGGVSFLIKPKLLDRAIEQGFMEMVEEAAPNLPVPIFRVG